MIETLKVGIIIPVYKVKKEYFDKCLYSLINQSYKHLQIILIDDCSPDYCGKWCDEYTKLDSRIEVYHHKKNLGVSVSRNTGIEHLNANLVMFVDADDWLDLDIIEKVVSKYNNFKENKPDIVIFQGSMSYLNFEEPDIIKKENEWKTKEELNDLQVKSLSITLKNTPNKKICYDTAWAKLISVNFLKNSGVRFKKLAYREDSLFFQELIQKSTFVIEIPEGYYHYRMVRNSVVHNYMKNALDDQEYYLNSLWNFAKEYKKDNNYYKALYAITLVSMQICITNYLYNKCNKDTYKNKTLKCRKFFTKKPFCNVFKILKLTDLKINFLIKAFCIKLKWFYGVELLRQIYMKIKKYKCFE